MDFTSIVVRQIFKKGKVLIMRGRYFDRRRLQPNQLLGGGHIPYRACVLCTERFTVSLQLLMYSNRKLKPLTVLSIRFPEGVARLRVSGLVAFRSQTLAWTTLLKFDHVSFTELRCDLYHAPGDFRVAHVITSQFGYDDRSIHTQLATSVSLVRAGCPLHQLATAAKGARACAIRRGFLTRYYPVVRSSNRPSERWRSCLPT